MILGIGTDLIEHARMQRELEKSPWAGNDSIFTTQEVALCDASKRSTMRYAACFAAKEATLKALGLEVRDLAIFREVELTADSEGAHRLLLVGRIRARYEQIGARHIRLSIAATRKLTGAIVVLES